MSDKKYKLAFIGGGVNSTIGKIHRIAATMDNKWQISSGVFSRGRKNNIISSKIYGIEQNRIYQNIDQFLNNEKNKIDVIVLLVPTPERFKYLSKILKFKIPVISEKPLVHDYNSFKKLQKLKINKNFLRVTYNYSGYPLIKELSELISKNYFGKIKQLHFEMPQDAFTSSTSKNIKPKRWRLIDGYIPNISHDLGSHLVSLTYFLFDEYPSEVMCQYFKSTKYRNLIDNGYFWLKFKSGIKGSYWISKSVPGIRNGMKLRIIGEKKSAQWLQIRPEELQIFNENGSREVIDNLTFGLKSKLKKYNRYKVGHPAGFLEAFGNLYTDYFEDFDNYKNNRLKTKKHKIFDYTNSKNIAKFFHASSKSFKRKVWIKI